MVYRNIRWQPFFLPILEFKSLFSRFLNPHLLPVLLGGDVSAEVARVVHGLQLAEDVDVGRAVHLAEPPSPLNGIGHEGAGRRAGHLDNRLVTHADRGREKG